MPRVARIVIPDLPYHITQRGNNRQAIFFVDDDRRVYLTLLKTQAERHGVEFHGYCLMSNHVHLSGTPRQAHSLARTLGRAHYLYTLYINRAHGRSGPVAESLFFVRTGTEASVVCNAVRGT